MLALPANERAGIDGPVFDWWIAEAYPPIKDATAAVAAALPEARRRARTNLDAFLPAGTPS